MDVSVAAFRPFALFREASELSLKRLAERAEHKVLQDSELLWRMGDTPAVAHFIVRGLVQIVKRLPNGDEASLGLFGPSECAGILAVLGPGHPYPADAIAASDEVSLLRLPTSLLKEILASDPAVARAANSVLVEHAQLLRAKIDVLSAGEIPQRLATLLLHLGERFGDAVAAGELLIPVALSRRTLSRLVGAREETVIRVMTRWDRQGLVETTAGGFVVTSVAKLVRVMEGSVED